MSLFFFYTFWASLAILLVYYLVFFTRLAFYKKVDKKASEIGISVIVCAHDEEENLRKLLPRLYDQEYSTFEIIIVNDRSNDGTYDLLREESALHTNLKAVQVDHTPGHVNGKKFGLTLGIKAAQYPWVLLTDADCFPSSKQWIAEVAQSITDEKEISLGFSPYEKRGGLLNAFIRFETIYTAIQYLSFALARMPYMGVGRNLAYKKSLFLDNKGFNHHLHVTGGDDDLFVNQHAKGHTTAVFFGDKSITYSIPKTTWSEYFTQKKRHLSVGKLYKFTDKIKIGLLQLAHLGYWIGLIGTAVYFVQPYWLLGGLITKLLAQGIVFHCSTRKLGTRFAWYWVPFLDFLYCFYYITIGFKAFFAKKITWK